MASFTVPSAFSKGIGFSSWAPKLELFTNTLRTMVENKDSFDDATSMTFHDASLTFNFFVIMPDATLTKFEKEKDELIAAIGLAMPSYTEQHTYTSAKTAVESSARQVEQYAEQLAEVKEAGIKVRQLLSRSVGSVGSCGGSNSG